MYIFVKYSAQNPSKNPPKWNCACRSNPYLFKIYNVYIFYIFSTYFHIFLYKCCLNNTVNSIYIYIYPNVSQATGVTKHLGDPPP